MEGTIIGIVFIGFFGLMPAMIGVRAIVTKELEFSNEDGTPATILRGPSAVVVGAIATVFSIGVMLSPDRASTGGP